MKINLLRNYKIKYSWHPGKFYRVISSSGKRKVTHQFPIIVLRQDDTDLLVSVIKITSFNKRISYISVKKPTTISTNLSWALKCLRIYYLLPPSLCYHIKIDLSIGVFKRSVTCHYADTKNVQYVKIKKQL